MKFYKLILIMAAALALVIAGIAGQGLLVNRAASNDSSPKEPKNKMRSQPTPPTNNNENQNDVGSSLNFRTETLIAETEPDWKLTKNLSSDRSESSYRVWENDKKQISLSIKGCASVEEAKLTFIKSKDPFSAPVSFEGKEISEFGDYGAYLRPHDPKAAKVSLSFSVGKYYVSITGETSVVLRFAKHIQSVLNSQSP